MKETLGLILVWKFWTICNILKYALLYILKKQLYAIMYDPFYEKSLNDPQNTKKILSRHIQLGISLRESQMILDFLLKMAIFDKKVENFAFLSNSFWILNVLLLPSYLAL